MTTWRGITDWVGFYEVSDTGLVRSVARRLRGPSGRLVSVRERILKPGTNPKGYEIVVLARDGQRYAVTVHSLVAAAFIGPRPAGAYICHNDDDPRNNNVGNLRYDSPRGNNLDTVNHGRHHNAIKTHCPRGHAYDEPNTLVEWRADRPHRKCRDCKRARQSAQRARQRAA